MFRHEIGRITRPMRRLFVQAVIAERGLTLVFFFRVSQPLHHVILLGPALLLVSRTYTIVSGNTTGSPTEAYHASQLQYLQWREQPRDF